MNTTVLNITTLYITIIKRAIGATTFSHMPLRITTLSLKDLTTTFSTGKTQNNNNKYVTLSTKTLNAE